MMRIETRDLSLVQFRRKTEALRVHLRAARRAAIELDEIARAQAIPFTSAAIWASQLEELEYCGDVLSANLSEALEQILEDADGSRD